MGRFIVIFLVLFFFAVSCEEKKEEVIDFTDVMQESKRYKENNEKVQEINQEEDTTFLFQKIFTDNGITINRLTIITQRMFPERFGILSSNKFELIQDNDTLHYFNWRYKDSVETMNAFYNWMDHFGEKGKSIRVGEEKGLQINPLIIFVGDTNLIFIEAKSNINEKEWEVFFENLGYKKWHYFLKQRKYGKVKWFVDGEEIKI